MRPSAPLPQVLADDDEDLDPSIEATLPVILRLLHAAAIDTNDRFDAAAAELNEHDEDEEGDEDDGDEDDVGGGRGRKSRKRKQRKAIAAVEKTSTALSTHLAKAMAPLLQRFGTHAGPLRAMLALVQQMRLASAQATLKDKAFGGGGSNGDGSKGDGGKGGGGSKGPSSPTTARRMAELEAHAPTTALAGRLAGCGPLLMGLRLRGAGPDGDSSNSSTAEAFAIAARWRAAAPVTCKHDEEVAMSRRTTFDIPAFDLDGKKHNARLAYTIAKHGVVRWAYTHGNAHRQELLAKANPFLEEAPVSYLQWLEDNEREYFKQILRASFGNGKIQKAFRAHLAEHLADKRELVHPAMPPNIFDDVELSHFSPGTVEYGRPSNMGARPSQPPSRPPTQPTRPPTQLPAPVPPPSRTSWSLSKPSETPSRQTAQPPSRPSTPLSQPPSQPPSRPDWFLAHAQPLQSMQPLTRLSTPLPQPPSRPPSLPPSLPPSQPWQPTPQSSQPSQPSEVDLTIDSDNERPNNEWRRNEKRRNERRHDERSPEAGRDRDHDLGRILLQNVLELQQQQQQQQHAMAQQHLQQQHQQQQAWAQWLVQASSAASDHAAATAREAATTATAAASVATAAAITATTAAAKSTQTLGRQRIGVAADGSPVPVRFVLVSSGWPTDPRREHEQHLGCMEKGPPGEAYLNTRRWENNQCSTADGTPRVCNAFKLLLVDVGFKAPFRHQFLSPDAPPLTLFGLAAPGYDGGPNCATHVDKVLRQMKMILEENPTTQLVVVGCVHAQSTSIPYPCSPMSDLSLITFCSLAAQPSKLPAAFAKHDQGGGHINWPAIRSEVLSQGHLDACTAILTRSGHIALGISYHVGRDEFVREFALAIDAFNKKPIHT